MNQEPHYPSSAELAAFRRTMPGGRYHAAFSVPLPDRSISRKAQAGAHGHERQHGIGAPYAEHRGQSDVDGRSSSYARRMASAQRTAEANVPNECCSGYVWSHAAYCENR